MGFEVCYKYHSGTGPGQYNTEETQTGSIKVGSPYEEVGLEVLAGKIMALMARRNILVTEVEVLEIVKKPLTFKEVEDGIILKNRKFRFDDGPALTGGEEVPESQAEQLALLQKLVSSNPQLLATIQGQPPRPMPAGALPSQPVPGRPIRQEMYSPQVDLLSQHDRQRMPALRFTKGKMYPIYEEKPAPGGNIMAGMVYVTQDDNGKRMTLSDKFFTLPTRLVQEGMVQEKESGLSEANLLFTGVESNADMPDLRAKR